YEFTRRVASGVDLLGAEGLAGLPADDLALVADALALVGLGGADLPDHGRELADGLLVGPADDDVGRVGDDHAHAGRGLQDALVGDPDREGARVRLLERGLVADADDLEPLGVARRDALDHVGDQAPGQAVERPVLALVVATGHEDLLTGLVVLHPDRLA